MTKLFTILRKSEKGATAIEYGLIAALISTALIIGAGVIGDQMDSTFDTVGTALTNANS